MGSRTIIEFVDSSNKTLPQIHMSRTLPYQGWIQNSLIIKIFARTLLENLLQKFVPKSLSQGLRTYDE